MRVFFIGLSNKIGKQPLSSETLSGGLIDKIIDGLGFDCIKTNLVNFSPLGHDGRLRYPKKEEMDEGFKSLAEELSSSDPYIAVCLGSKVSSYLDGKIQNIISIKHPAHIAVYKRGCLNEYIDMAVQDIKLLAKDIMGQIFFKEAAKIALMATCTHARCGCVVVSDEGHIIGSGYNAPPLGLENQRMCRHEGFNDLKPKYDKTCCVHAEWNAIIDALKNNPDKINGSTLYFMRISEDGGFTDAGKPFCTVCSRLALQSGIRYFGLWDGSPKIYDTKDYNKLSYDFHTKNPCI